MRVLIVASVVLATASPAGAQTARELLTVAAYDDRDQATALAHIDKARASAQAAFSRRPDDQDAAIVAAIATGYRAKLTGARAEALAARRQIEAVAQRYPRNAEAQLALGAWHLGIVKKVGRMLARAGAGARRDVGLAALDKAVALGGNRASITGFVGLLRIEADAEDARGRALVEAATRGATPTSIDRINQRAASLVAGALRRGQTGAARTLADRLLPFGWYKD